MNIQVSVRPYHSDDRGSVMDLLRQALGESRHLRRTAELFAWKHLDNPFGRSIMLIAEDAEGIVGFRAFMRWELDTPDRRRVRCVRPVDTATHPRARRQGIFRRLTMAALDEARANGVELVFNTPNPRSGAGYLTMGWTRVGRIGVMLRPLAAHHWKRGGSVPNVSNGVPWDDRVLDDRDPRGLRTPRTQEYMTWRFGSNPSARYCIVGDSAGTALVRPNVRSGRRELVVSEVFGTRARAAIGSAARKTDAAYLVAWFPPGTPERAAAVRAGLIPLPGATSLTLFAKALSGGIQFDRLEHWDISLGDLELL